MQRRKAKQTKANTNKKTTTTNQNKQSNKQSAKQTNKENKQAKKTNKQTRGKNRIRYSRGIGWGGDQIHAPYCTHPIDSVTCSITGDSVNKGSKVSRRGATNPICN